MIEEQSLQSLTALFGPRQLITDPAELLTYELDAGLSRGHPDAVVLPRSQEDVVRLVRWASEHGVPLVARSSGTGLSGGAVASRGGIVVSFARMNRILAFRELDRLVEAEPGVVNLTLDTKMKSCGFYYPPDPASQRVSAIGGNIAENAGGPHCFKYGVTTNYVKRLDVVLADGTAVHTGGCACDYPEYDFTGLLCGSEGTLAVVTSATLRIIRRPTGFKTMLASFDSVEQAGHAVSAIIARGLVPAALEMMDRNILRIIEDFAHAGLPTDAEALLLVEVDGYPQSLDAQMDEIDQVLRAQGVRQTRVCQTPEEREKIWLARKSAFGAMARISPAYFQVDGTVPRSRLAETLSEINRICAGLGLRVAYVFHAGDGNLHPLIPFDPALPAMEEAVHRAGDQIMATCVSKGGTISGEHGIGLEKRKYMPLMFTADELSVMQDIKELFDPQEILNPGKIFPEGSRSNPSPTTIRANADPLPPIFAPQTEEEAAEGLLVAQSLGQAVFIGQSPASQTLPDKATVLSVGGLNRILSVSVDDLYVVAEAGVKIAELQAVLAERGMWIPIASPWETEATVGGIVSAGLNSPFQMRYGAIRDQVLGMNVILPDGRRLRLGRPVVKNVAGYDLTKLFVGAHGTLGLITNVILKLSALPRDRRTLTVPVQDLSAGLQLGASLYRMSQLASAVLLCSGSLVSELPGRPYCLLFTAEGHEHDVQAELHAMHSISDGIEVDEPSGVSIWKRALHSATSPVRVGIPPTNMLEFLVARPAASATDFVADLSTGTIHFPAAPLDQALALRTAALALGGYAVILNGSAGVDPWGYRPETLPLMRLLKARWDPKGILNPGIFLV